MPHLSSYNIHLSVAQLLSIVLTLRSSEIQDSLDLEIDPLVLRHLWSWPSVALKDDFY